MRSSLLLTRNTNGAASLGCHSKLAKQLTCTQKQKREGATFDK